MTSSERARSEIPVCPKLVVTQRQLEALLDELSSQPAIAVDTESNSLYAYREQVCLIQFSTPNGDYLVDPLADLDIAPLARVFADSAMEKVFHAAEYDVMCLRRDFGFHFANLFDTMWAARILGWPRVGLGDILNATFGVRTNKRYQRYNWGMRPLEQDALAYACLDTRYLLPLRQLQGNALLQRGRSEEAQEVFEEVACSEASPRPFAAQGFWRIKGASKLTGREQAILRQLYVWRDGEARRKDTPPFKVLGDRTLVSLATATPRSKSDLVGMQGMRSHHVRRYGEGILRAVKLGIRSKPPPLPPPPPRHSRMEKERYNELRAWRKRVAGRQGVDPDVILGNHVLWSLVEQNPAAYEAIENIDGLGPWKRDKYGSELLRVLKGR